MNNLRNINESTISLPHLGEVWRGDAAWLCRFVSVDPLQFEYPELTPFQYASNNPVTMIDLDGLEGVEPDEVENNTIKILDTKNFTHNDEIKYLSDIGYASANFSFDENNNLIVETAITRSNKYDSIAEENVWFSDYFEAHEKIHIERYSEAAEGEYTYFTDQITGEKFEYKGTVVQILSEISQKLSNLLEVKESQVKNFWENAGNSYSPENVTKFNILNEDIRQLKKDIPMKMEIIKQELLTLVEMRSDELNEHENTPKNNNYGVFKATIDVLEKQGKFIAAEYQKGNRTVRYNGGELKNKPK